MKIKNSGNLRRFLADTMVEVKAGTIDVEKAGRITKLAAQINESFYSEVKVAKVRADAGEKLIELGALEIGLDSEESVP